MPKDRVTRRIDATPPVKVGSVTAPSSSASSPAPPAFTGILPPSNVQLTTALYQSAVTPASLIGVTWDPPDGYDVLTYIVQYSTSSTFATDYASVPADQASATLYPVKPNTLYYVRVAAVYRGLQSNWSTAASITTAQDTTPPAAPTAQTATFINGGDLVVTWTNPTSANFKDVEIKIFASNGGALLATVYDATGRFVWTVRQNLAATSNVGDPSLYIELRARSWQNVFSASTVSVSATKAAPAAPTVTLTGGFGLLVCQVTSAPESVYSVFEYVWKRDTVTQRTLESPAREQQYETGAAGDEGSHSWTCTVRQKDAFGQYSTATASSTVVLDTLTITYLRAAAFYKDSDANTFTPPNSGTLAPLKDGDGASGGVSYAA